MIGKKNIFITAIAIATFALLPFALSSAARAQTTGMTSLTITPPFFTINVSPGDAWASSVRVVNTMGTDLPVVASVMGFTPSDEQGHGTFINRSDLENDPDALANWIILASSSAVIAPDSAVDVPFSIAVPRDAAPGGHYAGILIGTQPASGGTGGSHVGISSFISALIFVTVSGDTKEAGTIRDFSTDHSLYQDPNVNFSLSFANTGNVHVRPVGEIQIYNMFGRQVGTVPINQEGGLGYVLPSSTRKFEAQWQGPGSILNIGQFTAIVTVAYGVNGTKSASQAVTFWVLPFTAIAEDLGALILIVGGFIFFLRRSVKKMLAREMGQYGRAIPPLPSAPKLSAGKKESEKNEKDGTVDLRKRT